MAKHLQSDMKGNFIDVTPGRYKSKPREIEYTHFLNATRERDRLWWKEGKFREYLKGKYNL